MFESGIAIQFSTTIPEPNEGMQAISNTSASIVKQLLHSGLANANNDKTNRIIHNPAPLQGRSRNPASPAESGMLIVRHAIAI
ncbi:MAG: hypothetical protein OXD29_01910 [Roseovarius sp.]|nr:hypothetical protein [Roseovarius sp.]